MKREKNLREVLRRVTAANSGACALTVIVILMSVAAALFPPLVLERVINRLTAGQSVAASLAFLYFGLIALSGVLESGQNVMITVFGQKVTHALRSAMCAKLRFLPAGFYTEHESGGITSRFVNDVDTVDTLFTNGIVSMFADACRVLSILGVIFYKSTGLGLLMLLVTPLIFAVTRSFQRRMLRSQLENRAAVGRVNNHVPETIRNIRMIHVLRREKYMEERYGEYINESYRATNKSNIYDSVYSPIIVFISSCVISVMMVCAAMGGGMREFFGISVGTAVAMISYVGKIFSPIEGIGMEIQNIQSAVAGVRRIDEFLAQPERRAPEQAGTQVRPEADPAIVFDGVSFGYGGDANVLDDLSFSVARGENVTLVGRTGAGKSTIFRLLLGLYEPRSGSVTVAGIPAADIPDNKKRRLYGYVEQTFRMAEGTVADQISFFDPSIDRDAAERAAEFVGLHEAISALPLGYETPCEKAAFSQGQYQLLSIARAVAASPGILLLDEITANLDSDTESRVLSALERASEGRTVLSISHRLEANSSGRVIGIGKEA
jgi:ATP-binding cassette subfamily B multidrug efflux pump